VSQAKLAPSASADDGQWLSLEQGRLLARVSREAMFGLAVEGKLLLRRIGPRWYVNRATLDAWMSDGAVAA
jgi:hypothetical protein